MYGKGISREGSLLDIAVDRDIVKKSGAWYTYEGEQIGQGRENVKNYLIENPDLVMEIQDRVLREVGLIVDESEEIDLVAEEPAKDSAKDPAKDDAPAKAKGKSKAKSADDEPITLD